MAGDGPTPDVAAGDGGSDALSNDAVIDPGNCGCALDQVCAAGGGGCIARPTPTTDEVLGELVLLEQLTPRDTGIFSALGKGEASLFFWEELPADDRPSWTTVEGERCTWEMNTLYPYRYNDATWPTGRGLGAGDLTFKVVGGESDVVLEEDEDNGSFAYFHGDTPPALSDGTVTLPDFFDTEYLPAGAGFEVEAAGGSDLTAQTLAGGELPAAFTVIDPPENQVGQVAANVDLTVRWTPAQPAAYMEIFLTRALGFDYLLLSCKVKDDGVAVIPAAALADFTGDVGFQLRRSLERYRTTQTASGDTVHAYLIGRHARLGRMMVQ
jgi:hypothetical protein